MEKGRKRFWGKARRVHLADILAKIVGYIVSLYIIGNIVAATLRPEVRINPWYLVVAGAVAAVISIAGLILTPGEDHRDGR